MSELARAPIRFVDRLVAATQTVGQHFGFLHDGRESVDVVREDDALRVTLPDLEREGWPPVSVRIPPQFEFAQATSSILTRVALFTAPGSVTDARRWFADLGIELSGPRSALKLGDAAGLTVRASGDRVLVGLKQRRDEKGLERAVRNRATGSDQSS